MAVSYSWTNYCYYVTKIWPAVCSANLFASIRHMQKLNSLFFLQNQLKR